ncbi:MAG: PDZ domain-containing protein, partial [Planctomycetaceae bacterium]|nr:PDZ domain-containing protein [Planctomycetaceae bacterium]
MDEQARPTPDVNLPRAHFHLTLALILVPCGAVIAGWTLAIIDVLKGYSNRAQLVWMRLLVALVVVDAFVLAAVLWLGAHLEEIQKKALAAQNRPMIGVVFESDASLKVQEPQADGPAARAGVRTGDVVDKIDGKPVATMKALAEALQEKAPGEPRTLTLVRDGKPQEATVTPEAPPMPGERGLFQIEKAPETSPGVEAALALFPALFLVAVYALWARWKTPGRVRVWAGFLLALLGSMGGFGLFVLCIRKFSGGISLGHFLVAVLIQGVLMLGLTWIARRFL